MNHHGSSPLFSFRYPIRFHDPYEVVVHAELLSKFSIYFSGPRDENCIPEHIVDFDGVPIVTFSTRSIKEEVNPVVVKAERRRLLLVVCDNLNRV